MDNLAVSSVLKTLGDPTRRAILEAILERGEATVGALTQGARVSQPAVSQHLKALRTAGLVSERRDGRKVHYRAAPEGLAPLVDWIAVYGAFWRTRLGKLKSLLKEMDE